MRKHHQILALIGLEIICTLLAIFAYKIMGEEGLMSVVVVCMGITVLLALIALPLCCEREGVLHLLAGCYQAMPDDLKPLLEDAVAEVGLNPCAVLDESLRDR